MYGRHFLSAGTDLLQKENRNVQYTLSTYQLPHPEFCKASMPFKHAATKRAKNVFVSGSKATAGCVVNGPDARNVAKRHATERVRTVSSFQDGSTMEYIANGVRRCEAAAEHRNWYRCEASAELNSGNSVPPQSLIDNIFQKHCTTLCRTRDEEHGPLVDPIWSYRELGRRRRFLEAGHRDIPPSAHGRVSDQLVQQTPYLAFALRTR
ncbi:hypothetical protein P885DRAFT_58357 [Corynascus similis CBS 632.67]